MTTDKTPEPKRQMEAKTMDELRIVLFGHIFPKKDLFKIIHDAGNFKPALHPEDGTQVMPCQEYRVNIKDRNVVIIDTPGVDKCSKDKPKALEEIKWSVAAADPGPHVFLFVQAMNESSRDQLDALKDFQQIFGEQANDFTMMVFITNKNEKNIKPFRKLTYPFNHRYFIFNTQDNKQQQQESQQESQVTELLEKTAQMRGEDSERVYTPKMLWEAEKAVKQQEEEEIKQEEEKQKQKKEKWFKVRDKLYVIGAHLGATIGFLLSAFFPILDSSAAGAVGSIVGVIIVVVAFLVAYYHKFIAKEESDSKEKKDSEV